jgi:hypothetical protein
MSGGMEECSDWEYQDKVKLFVSKTSTDLVIQDMKQREIFGYKKYNKYLTDKTDEDMLQHLYEELLDASVYIKTLLEQRKQT